MIYAAVLLTGLGGLLIELVLVRRFELKHADLSIADLGGITTGQEVVIGNAEECEGHSDKRQDKQGKFAGESVTNSLQHISRSVWVIEALAVDRQNEEWFGASGIVSGEG